jgi:hypothetical protein
VRTGSTTATFTYDAAGNTLTRPGATLTWDAEGRLATNTDATGTSSYVYAKSDPSGLCSTDACISHQYGWDDRDKPPLAPPSFNFPAPGKQKPPSFNVPAPGSKAERERAARRAASARSSPPPKKKPGFFGRTWNWIKDNRGANATVIATGLCFVPALGWVSCAGLQAGAAGMRAWERADEGGGWGNTWKESTADGVMTFATAGVGGASMHAVRFGRAGWGLRAAPTIHPNLTPKPTGGPFLGLRQRFYNEKSNNLVIWQRQFPGGFADPGLRTLHGLGYVLPSQLVSRRDMYS